MRNQVRAKRAPQEKMAGELESVEALLEKAGKQPLEPGELSELKRVFYGNAAK